MAQKKVNFTQEQFNAINEMIAQAVAEALANNKGGKKSGSSKKSSTYKTAKKQVEVEPLQLMYDEDEMTVELNRFVRNRNVFGFVNKMATECKGEYDRENNYWSFKSSRSLNKFLGIMGEIDLNELTEEQLEEGHEFNASKRTSYTDEEKKAYRESYQELWDKYVEDCKKKGIKRTKEMNRAKSAEIKAQIA